MTSFISIVTGCYNEHYNITELHDRICKIMATLPQYDFELICIDNFSTDGTREEIRDIARTDPRFKAIFNARNFGHIRSPWHVLLQAHGDVVIAINSDLEDPPELIPEFLAKWEQGYKIVAGVRASTDEKGIMPHVRSLYYTLLRKISDVEQIKGFTGFGLYDKSVVNTFRSLNDPYPYVRGLIAEFGWKRADVPFHKPYRTRGVSKGNVFIYLDMALLAVVNHSKLPLRLATLTGIIVSMASFLGAGYYSIRKLLFWDEFQAGIAPAIIGLFFLMGLLFMFLGLIGEYVGLVVTHVINRPLVIEEERINFKAEP